MVISNLEPLESLQKQLFNGSSCEIFAARRAECRRKVCKKFNVFSRFLKSFRVVYAKFARKVRGAPHGLGVRFFFVIKTKGSRRFEVGRSAYSMLVLFFSKTKIVRFDESVCTF